MSVSPARANSALHNALAEETPAIIRQALEAGAHPLDHNVDGKNVWDVILSTKVSKPTSTLSEVGTAARDFKDVVSQMAQIPPRNYEEAMALLGYEKQAIEKKHQGVASASANFVRDCLGLATQIPVSGGLSWLQQHEILHARHANHALEQRLGGVVPSSEFVGLPSVPAETLALSGNQVSIPLQAGEPALHQGQAAGRAPQAVSDPSPEAPEDVFRFATVSERRERLAQPARPTPDARPGAPKP